MGDRIDGPNRARSLTMPPLAAQAPTKLVQAAPVAPKAPESSDTFASSPQEVVVRPGDTLGAIASRHNLSMAQLRELNPSLFTEGRDAQGNRRAANGHWIYPGDRIQLRPEAVQAGGYSSGAVSAKLKAVMETLGETDQLPLDYLSTVPQAQPPAQTKPLVQAEAPAKAETSAPARPAEVQAAGSQERQAQPATQAQSRPVLTPPVQLPTSAPAATTQPVQLPPAPPAASSHTESQPAANSTKPVQLPPSTPKAAGNTAGPIELQGHKTKVYSVERWDASRKPTTPPPVPANMTSGAPISKDAQILMGALLIGMSFTDMSMEAQQKIGDSAVGDILGTYPLYTKNPDVVRHVSAVGAKMVALSNRSDIDWHFYVVESKDINAFALPGGHVFITTAALKNLKSEDELAAVLGHEIAHVEKGHGAKKLQRAMISQGIAIAALADHGASAQMAGQLAVSVALKGYDRDAEDEADNRGVELATRAGYDPHGLLGFFDTLQTKHPDSGGLPTWASDHPPTSDRIKRVNDKISREGLQAGGQVNQDRFHQVMAAI